MRLLRSSKTELARIAHDADHGEQVRVQANLLSERDFVGPEAPRSSLIDDNYLCCVSRITVTEFVPRAKRDSHCRKVSGARYIEKRLERLYRGRSRLAYNMEGERIKEIGRASCRERV